MAIGPGGGVEVVVLGPGGGVEAVVLGVGRVNTQKKSGNKQATQVIETICAGNNNLQRALPT